MHNMHSPKYLGIGSVFFIFLIHFNFDTRELRESDGTGRDGNGIVMTTRITAWESVGA